MALVSHTTYFLYVVKNFKHTNLLPDNNTESLSAISNVPLFSLSLNEKPFKIYLATNRFCNVFSES